jgi:hypothetical protein
MTLIRLCLALFIGFSGAVASAETRIALVIGNGGYESIGRLRNAPNDAELIAVSLVQTGFAVTKAIDLDEDAMGQVIDQFLDQARNADVAAVYYAGHGIQKDGENYLLPIDAQLTSVSAISREGIALSDLTRGLEDVPISLIFLDACRNNPFAEALLARSASSSRNAGVQRGLAVVQTTGDMMVAFATLPNTTASDGVGENSPFARALARHIPAPGIEVSLLMKRVTADVMQETGEEQRPQQLSQMQREFYFAPPQTQATSAAVEGVNRSLLTVYPSRVTVGEEVSVVADVQPGCTPAFVNVAPSGRVIPVPTTYFKTVAMAGGQTRYEISPGSRYGLVVQDQDEKGGNQFGFFCLPPGGEETEVKRALLRGILQSLSSGTAEGTLAQPFPTYFQFRSYQID